MRLASSRSLKAHGKTFLASGLSAVLMLPVGGVVLASSATAAGDNVDTVSRRLNVSAAALQGTAASQRVTIQGVVTRGRRPLANAKVKIQRSKVGMPRQPSVGATAAKKKKDFRWVSIRRSKAVTNAEGRFRKRVRLPKAAWTVSLRVVLVKPRQLSAVTSRKIRVELPTRERPTPVTSPTPTPSVSLPTSPTPEAPDSTSPTPEAPEGSQRTVLLIPGYSGVTVQLESLSRWLAQRDVKSEVIDIGDGLGDLRSYAQIVEDRATEIIAAGGPAPDLIGYSAGGITARTAFSRQPHLFRKNITLASPHQGTLTAVFAEIFGNCPTGCQQMQPGSDLLDSLPDPQRPSDWLSVWSQNDEAIVPASSSVLPLITNYRIQDVCADRVIQHGGVPSDPQVRALIEAFLAEESIPQTCLG